MQTLQNARQNQAKAVTKKRIGAQHCYMGQSTGLREISEKDLDLQD